MELQFRPVKARVANWNFSAIGHIAGIKDIVTFEGESVGELRRDFENAVSSYLKTCAEMGKTPERQCSGKLLVRLPRELHQEISLEAEVDGRSINDLVLEAIKDRLANSSRPSRTMVKKPRPPKRLASAGA